MADSITYFPFHTPRGNTAVSNILDSAGGSWLGKVAVNKGDSVWLFDNMWGRRITIKCNSAPGDQWTFYNDTGGYYYKAILTSIDTITLLGSVDSARRIIVAAFNAAGPVHSDPLDSMAITLTKDHGFARVFDLYCFPYHAPGIPFNSSVDYYTGLILQGETLSKDKLQFNLVDLVNPSFSQMNQWGTGDEFQYAECDGIIEYLASSMCTPAEHYYFDSVINTGVVSDTLTIQYTGWRSDYSSGFMVNTNSGSAIFGPQTVVDTILMPEEYKQVNSFYYYQGDTSYCMLSDLYKVAPTDVVGNIYMPSFESYKGYKLYKTALGLVFSTAYALAGTSTTWPYVTNYVDQKRLLFYRHDGVSCRQIVLPSTSVSELKAGQQFMLTPNPARDVVTLSANQIINDIVVYSLDGRSVMHMQPSAKNVSFDISILSAGLYIVNVNQSSALKLSVY